MVNSGHQIKMAADGNNERMMEIRGMGRAQGLWQAVQKARGRREEGLGYSSPTIPAGREGIVPQDVTSKSIGPQTWRGDWEICPCSPEGAGVELCLLHLPCPLGISLLCK